MNCKSGGRCCVYNCGSFSRTHRDLVDKKISFSKFPKDALLRKEWIARIQTSYNNQSAKRKRFEPKKNSLLCGLHFSKQGKKAYADKVPIYVGGHTLSKTVLISDIVILDEDASGICLNIGSETEIPSRIESLDSITVSLENTPESQNRLHSDHTKSDHSYGSTVRNNEFRLINQILVMKEKEKTMLTELENAKKTINCLQTENDQLKIELLRLKNEVKKKEQDVQRSKFQLCNVAKDNDMLKFYTGFSCIDDLNVLYRQVEPALATLSVYNNGKGYARCADRNNSSRGRPMALDFKEQLFLTVCKLRAGLLNKDLAFRFNISFTAVSNYITTWLDILYQRLIIIPICPSREVVDEFMPDTFKEKFPTTRVVIDCTEFFIERPSDYGTQCDTYSNYKRHTTAKGLIGASPNGFVSYVAPLAPGRESDTELTTNCGLIDLLEKGDSVMADRGFLVHEVLATKGVDLNMPPFLGDRSQLSKVDEQKTRDIASVRIHIERVIRELKNFRILKYTFPNSMHANLEKIWVICCYLLNFINEPLLNRKEKVAQETVHEF